MIFPYPLLECLTNAATFFLTYFTLHLEQKNLRIAKSIKTCSEFKTSSKALFNRAQNQGDNAVALKRTLSKYFGRHFEVFKSSMMHPLHSQILFLIKL